MISGSTILGVHTPNQTVHYQYIFYPVETIDLDRLLSFKIKVDPAWSSVQYHVRIRSGFCNMCSAYSCMRQIQWYCTRAMAGPQRMAALQNNTPVSIAPPIRTFWQHRGGGVRCGQHSRSYCSRWRPFSACVRWTLPRPPSWSSRFSADTRMRYFTYGIKTSVRLPTCHTI